VAQRLSAAMKPKINPTGGFSRPAPGCAQLTWRRPPRPSAERSDARVERTLLSVDFDPLKLTLVLNQTEPAPRRAGAPARCLQPTPRFVYHGVRFAEVYQCQKTPKISASPDHGCK
jgi:hypothetical protein